VATIVIPSRTSRPPLALQLRRLVRLPWLPILLLAPVVVCGVFGSLIFPHDPTAIDLMAPRKAPVFMTGGTWDYVLGTDQFGRDLLSRLMEGSRVALIIALSSVFLAALIGVTAGMVAGYYAGAQDQPTNFFLRIADALLGIVAFALAVTGVAAVVAAIITIVVSPLAGMPIPWPLILYGVIYAVVAFPIVYFARRSIRRHADNIVMRVADVVFAIPAILLIILIGGAVGGGFLTVLTSIVLVSWVLYARVVRGETLVLRERGFVALAKVANCTDARILVRHILPNLMPTCIVLMTLQAGFALLIEAAITFIGLGIQPPATTWGLLISEGRPYMTTAWWIPTFAGLAITVTVLGTNLLGDWLQEKFDPRRAER
jgi:ABC-type dipeptide/oligopeptide/nickel transport system permease subunit